MRSFNKEVLHFLKEIQVVLLEKITHNIYNIVLCFQQGKYSLYIAYKDRDDEEIELICRQLQTLPNEVTCHFYDVREDFWKSIEEDEQYIILWKFREWES